MHQLAINISIVNDSIPEDAEVFTVSLTLNPADKARLGSVTVYPGIATVTIQDDDGKHLIINTIIPHVKLEQV